MENALPCYSRVPDRLAAAPLIVTLALDAALEGRLERDRQACFPAERNVVPAHVSLFHQLPADQAQAVQTKIDEICAATACFDVAITAPQLFGRGVAYRVSCDAAVHDALSAAWRPWLTAQDRQTWRPHVTIQNKVERSVARDLHTRLMAGFAPFSGQAVGIRLWHYLGGPWALLSETTFKPE